MRAMLFKNRFDNVKPFYKHLNIRPLTKNIKLLQGKFMWKLLAKNIQTQLSSFHYTSMRQ